MPAERGHLYPPSGNSAHIGGLGSICNATPLGASRIRRRWLIVMAFAKHMTNAAVQQRSTQRLRIISITWPCIDLVEYRILPAPITPPFLTAIHSSRQRRLVTATHSSAATVDLVSHVCISRELLPVDRAQAAAQRRGLEPIQQRPIFRFGRRVQTAPPMSDEDSATPTRLKIASHMER